MTDRFLDDRADLIAELKAALGFLTRVPPRWFGFTGEPAVPVSSAARAFPAAGALIGLAGALVYALAAVLTLPPLVAAGAAIAVAAALTGALHEDGLADTADGFGGGTTAEAKLAIMRDSRIGTYGATALMLAILLRAGLIAGLGADSALSVVFALVAAEAVSRGAMVAVWQALPAARPGLSTTAGEPDETARNGALVLASGIGFAFGTFAVGPIGALVGLLGVVLAMLGFARLAEAQIGGRTGDTLGAAQQIALIVFLTLLLAFD
ncbi:adenosylcobinamide-GDP ribazoletransferase [Prosthecomicrobium pneumaticum]|uniref:Adenosylcobinamide-GDP ribazoletransferase n=1 Tax=Prosthecomicrobium pneumaticum TaxID=81895 RepID=A0A7W9FPZ1_9HYPH|nr:adenosylcobinamide-GDP ribazoletransferase [Prosthecomicrobium pneumaticum]MBB5754616.1 adenosylcobinamide-GDP ribazoletransferase [Prosthecomicrobium pneumaticum]